MTSQELLAYREHCATALARLRANNIEIVEQFWSKGRLHVQVVLDGTPRTLTVPADGDKK